MRPYVRSYVPQEFSRYIFTCQIVSHCTGSINIFFLLLEVLMNYVIFVLLVLFKRGDKRILPTSLDYMLSQMFVLYGHAMENIHMSNHTKVIITTPVKKYFISSSGIYRDQYPKTTDVLHSVCSKLSSFK